MNTMQKASILGGTEQIKEMILVSQTKNEVQIMDPETYKLNTIKKPENITLEPEKIKIVKFDEHIFLILKIHN